MKFFKENKKYINIAIITLMVIFSTVIFIEILNNGRSFILNIKSVLNGITNIISPFIVGFFIAFMLNAPSKHILMFLNKVNIFTKKRNLLVSLLITYTMFIGFFIIIIQLILPAIVISVSQLVEDIYVYVTQLQQDFQKALYSENNTFINDVISFVNQYTDYSIDVNAINFNNIYTTIVTPLLNWAQNLPNIVNQLINSIFSIINILFNLVLSIIISFYLLMEKNFFIDSAKKITTTLFNKKNSERILYVSSVTNSIFQKFLIGKTLDSLIIGFLFFIIAKIFLMPYALLFSVIIGITNMIPYFGPFIGAIPVVSILLIIDVKMALITAGMILALQQFDGLYLGPKILGGSTGVKPIGVIFAVTIGGRMFGSLGMLLGVPVFATFLYFFNEYMEKRHNEKLKKNKEYYSMKGSD